MSRSRALAGWLLGVSCFLLLMSVAPEPSPPSCADGWKSPSIGLQGACSHHGGVRRHIRWWPVPIAALSAFVGLWIGGAFARRQSHDGPPLPKSALEALIEESIRDGKTLHFRYQSKGSTTWHSRRVRPTSLDYISSDRRIWTPHIVGFCEDRQAERRFLLSRMRDIAVVD